MNFILLPGNSINNKEWIERVHKVFQDNSHISKILYYKHWENEEELINLEMKLQI